eukprot:jgi/Mesvir1/13782/Mv15951-RA.1
MAVPGSPAMPEYEYSSLLPAGAPGRNEFIKRCFSFLAGMVFTVFTVAVTYSLSLPVPDDLTAGFNLPGAEGAGAAQCTFRNITLPSILPHSGPMLDQQTFIDLGKAKCHEMDRTVDRLLSQGPADAHQGKLVQNFKEDPAALDALRTILPQFVLTGTRTVALTMTTMHPGDPKSMLPLLQNMHLSFLAAMPSERLMIVCTDNFTLSILSRVPVLNESLVPDVTGWGLGRYPVGAEEGHGRGASEDRAPNVRYAYMYYINRLGYAALSLEADQTHAKISDAQMRRDLRKGRTPAASQRDSTQQDKKHPEMAWDYDTEVALDLPDTVAQSDNTEAHGVMAWDVPAELRMRGVSYFRPVPCWVANVIKLRSCTKFPYSLCINSGVLFHRPTMRTLRFTAHMLDLLEENWEVWFEQNMYNFLAELHARRAGLLFDWASPFRVNNFNTFDAYERINLTYKVPVEERVLYHWATGPWPKIDSIRAQPGLWRVPPEDEASLKDGENLRFPGRPGN